MKFPTWSPADLIERYKFISEQNSPDSQKIKEIIFRLLTRPEMEKVWQWIYAQYMPLPIMVNGGVVGRFLYALDRFDKAGKYPASERSNDFDEIQRLAFKLSVKLNKYKDEMHIFNEYTALIPPSYDRLLISFLKEKHQEKIAERKLQKREVRFPIWNFLLPPISELLKSLSLAVKESDAELGKIFPTKINQDSALATYLVNFFYKQIYMGGLDHPPSVVATFISVALDDATITTDRVRKIRGTFQEKS